MLSARLSLMCSADILFYLVWGRWHPPPCLSHLCLRHPFLLTALNFAMMPFLTSLTSFSPGSYNRLGVNCLLKAWGLFCADECWSPMRIQLSAGVTTVIMQHSCKVHPAWACTLLDTKRVVYLGDFPFEHVWLFFVKAKQQFSVK